MTDRYELEPDDRREAVADIRRAAMECLVITDNPARRDRYFDR